MITLVGLGNPGARYARTRHNAGRMVLAHFVRTHAMPEPVASQKFSAEVSEGVVCGREVRVLFPETYMNDSGSAVKKAVRATDASTKLVVVHDDIDLAIGTVRISANRGAGGHRGVASIAEALGTKDFLRIRIGIAPVSFFGAVKKPRGTERVQRFVLQEFSRKEQEKIERAATVVVGAIERLLQDGREAAIQAVHSSQP